MAHQADFPSVCLSVADGSVGRCLVVNTLDSPKEDEPRQTNREKRIVISGVAFQNKRKKPFFKKKFVTVYC